MINLRKVHEEEFFDLESPRVLTWGSVEPILTRLGFALEDDFAERTRQDPVAPWQSEAMAACTFFAGGQQVYPDEADFSRIRYEVLVATLPEEQTKTAVHLLHRIAEELALPVSYAGRQVSIDSCLELVRSWQTDILTETGDVPGSESVRILIEMEYGKGTA